MSNLKEDLDLLEHLSKKISDLIYLNEFSQIASLDNHRKEIIRKITENNSKKDEIKTRIKLLMEKNAEIIKVTEKKLQTLHKNHNKFNNRLKAYSFNK
ncbi:MAG: hypothetical protein CMM64_02875 [Rhodospirillaceae bacterium]|nr:hypothetical protein [Rhodospirillaceae bacterium]|tara:strand:- start:813 stop:1106 length:294 start_codon:yes stop_codon:yes gene_type:complete